VVPVGGGFGKVFTLGRRTMAEANEAMKL